MIYDFYAIKSKEQNDEPQKEAPRHHKRRQSISFKHLKTLQNIGNMKKGLETLKEFQRSNATLEQFLYIRQVIERIANVHLRSYSP
jgi:hypothetical protein